MLNQEIRQGIHPFMKQLFDRIDRGRERCGVRFQDGGVSEITAAGYGNCFIEPVLPEASYRTAEGPYRHQVTWETHVVPADSHRITVSWRMKYR